MGRKEFDMLEYWYKERRTLVDFRRGTLGPHFDGFASYLKEMGYRNTTGKSVLGKCCLFNDYLIHQGIDECSGLSESIVEAFIEHHLADYRTTSLHEGTPKQCRAAAGMLLRYLRGIEVVKTRDPHGRNTQKVPAEHQWILDPYLRYLREDRKLAGVTIERHRTVCCAFLEGLGEHVSPTRMKSLNVEVVKTYLVKHLEDSPENRRSLTSSLRGFLRFCAEHGHTAEDLSGVVPSVPSYRHASLPRGIEDAALQRILNAVPLDTPIGARDYAIMLLMMAYGIRGKSAAELTLDDINWERSTIRIRAQKGGKEVILPLLEAVGEAILRYLRHRPATSFREVFLKVKAPVGPLKSTRISMMIREYMHKAGVHRPRGGSTMLRHSWAIRALAHDSPIKAIADVLGHQYLDTTFIYAKADLKMLEQVPMPWPEGR
ncbi:MAG: site-specific integrase [Verrucomicrobiota bacterium]